jgi:hypothetical protein
MGTFHLWVVPIVCICVHVCMHACVHLCCKMFYVESCGVCVLWFLLCGVILCGVVSYVWSVCVCEMCVCVCVCEMCVCVCGVSLEYVVCVV